MVMQRNNTAVRWLIIARGEGLTNPTAAALGNAVFNAMGIQMKELPITPERVLKALREKKEQETK